MPAASADDEHEAEQESREAGVREELQRNAVRRADVLGVVPHALPCDLERRCARASRRVGPEDLPGLPPPDRAVVRLELAETARPVDDLSGARQLVARPGDGVADRGNEAEQPGDDEHRRGADEAAGDRAGAAW